LELAEYSFYRPEQPPAQYNQRIERRHGDGTGPVMNGVKAFLEILHRAGVRYIFGNPGTTELPVNDALACDDRFRYILGLHEIPITAMADGYAMASGQLGVVNVHICCGLGNAMGMIYNAHIEGSPILIVAGQQDRRLVLGDPVLGGDMVSVVRPWVKWACEIQRIEDVPNAARRAIQTALTPPTGPVFLSLPLDLQTEPAEGLDLRPPQLADPRIRPGVESIRQAAQVLAAAKSPAILAGSRVTESSACGELVDLAERLGAPVYSECNTSHGRLPIPADHPLYQGALPLWTPEVRRLLHGHDVLFVAGMNVLRLYIWNEPDSPIPQSTRLIHLDVNAAELGKNFPVDVAMLGDIREGLRELCDATEPMLSSNQRRRAAEMLDSYRRARVMQQHEVRARIESEKNVRPMTASVLMNCIAKAAPRNLAFVEEATTTNQHLLERLGVLTDPAALFAHRGWALGWGIGCAIGVKLAWPERPVLGLIGDGASLYGFQGLWTAAHYRIPVTFVIANNAQYRILKVCGDLLPLPEMAKRNYLGMDLTGPEVDFSGLARSFGVEAHRVAEPAELIERLCGSWGRSDPLLLDVVLERN
jgi:benzoylformate decarboxylase